MTAEELKKKLSSGATDGIFYLCGEEQYLLDHYYREFRRVCAPVMPEFNLIELDGKKPDFDLLADCAASFPVMAEKKLVIVSDPDPAAFKGRGEKKLLAALNDPAPGVTVLFRDHARDTGKAGALENALKKAGAAIVKIERPKPEALANWVRRLAEQGGARIGAAESAYLAQLTGYSMLRLAEEVQKLCAYASGGEIDRAMIEMMVAPEEEASWFAISDAVAAHDFDRLMQAIRTLYLQGTDDVVIAGMFYRAYIDLRRGELALKEGKSSAELASVCGVSPYAAARMMRAARGMAEGETLYGIRKCCALDQNIKTSGLNKRDLIYAFAAELLEFQMRGL